MSKFIGYIGNNAWGADSGLRVVEADGETGALRLLQHLEGCETPAYLAVSPDKSLLACGHANSSTASPVKGMAAILSIGPDGLLTARNAMPSASQSSPCHLAFSPEGGHLYCSHYGDGRVTVFRVEASGSLWGPEQVIQHEGSGPTLPNQSGPRVHYGRFTPDGKYICFCDLGLDVVRVYEPDADGLLSFVKDIPVVRGAGARHLVFSHDGKFLYVVSELACLVTAFACHDGDFRLLGTVSSLEEEPSGKKAASAIRLSPDGRFLYVGNRFVNNIGVLQLGEQGMPELKANIPCAFPRDLNILPNGRFLYVCGQEEGYVQRFGVDAATGMLRPVDGYFPAPIPTCIEFL